MIKDFFVSFRDNFKDKVKNPFLGTYLLVWLIRNWGLIFTLFNFDKGISLDSKIKIIETYFNKNSFAFGIFENIGYTFLVLVVTYILLNISRAIVNMFEKQLKPIIDKKIDYKSVVTKENYERVRNERDNLLLRISEERDSKARIEIELKKVQDEIKDSNLKQTFSSPAFDESKLEERLETLYRDFLDKDLFEGFKRVILKIKKRRPFNVDDKILNPFLEEDLIKHEKTNGVSAIFELTDFGLNFSNYIKNRIWTN